MTSFTTNKNLETPANGEYVDQWEVPLNADMNILDAALGGVTNLNATSGSANLTTTQYQKLTLNITGAMSADVTYTIPNGVGGNWIIRNATTDATGGPWAVTIASGGGGSNVVALRGKNIMIWSDGTNIRNVDENVPSIGTVTSVGVSGGTTGLTTNNSPITSNGTITIEGVLNVASGGTGVTSSTGNGSVVLNTNPTFETKITTNGYNQSYGMVSLGLGAVSAPTLTPSGSGGNLAAATYYVKIVAVDGLGNATAPSNENSTSTTGTTSSIGITWSAVTGAASYQIWVATSSNAQTSYFTTSNSSYTLTTTAGATSGTIPTVNSTGYVGIGTSSPNATLSIVKQSSALSGAGNANGLYLYPTSSGLSYIDAITNSTGTSSLAVRTYNNGTYNNAIRIDSSGNVGVGTNTPATKLEVNGNISANAAANSRIRAYNTTGTAQTSGFGADSGIGWVGSETNTPFYFITNNTERFRIGALGELGIGGANYGTAGQVLTSQGANAAPTWSVTGPSAGTAVTFTSPTSATFANIPSTARRIQVAVFGGSSFTVQLATSSGTVTSGYTWGYLTVDSTPGGSGSSSGTTFQRLGGSGIMHLTRVSGNSWAMMANSGSSGSSAQILAYGSITLASTLTSVVVTSGGSSGTVNVIWD